MSGIRTGLLDSNILIYCSKGKLDFRTIASRYEDIFVSVVTYMEALGFNFPHPGEQAIIEAILNSIPIVQTNMDIAQQVVAYRRVRKIKTPDAIILATAKILGAEIVTVNEDDFKGLDPAVSIFVPALVLS